MALCAQSVNIANEADFDQFVVNRNVALRAAVLDALAFFFVLNVDAMDTVNDFKVGKVELA